VVLEAGSGRRARIPLCAGPGVRGDRELRSGSCSVSGANSDVAPSMLVLGSSDAAGDPADWGVRGLRPESPAQGGDSGPAGAGVAVGVKPKAELGWIINTLD
jgi:hypothetical protein